MKRTALVTSLVTAGVLLAAGGFFIGRLTSHGGAPQAIATSESTAPTGERKILYWHDPMVPGPRFDKPGKSPFMDMQLVPVYADEANDAGVKVSPTVQQNLGIRTTTVKRADVGVSFDAVGTVQFDERLSVAVQSRVTGYVEHLSVRAPMEQVRKGQALATILRPSGWGHRTSCSHSSVQVCLWNLLRQPVSACAPCPSPQNWSARVRKPGSPRLATHCRLR